MAKRRKGKKKSSDSGEKDKYQPTVDVNGSVADTKELEESSNVEKNKRGEAKSIESNMEVKGQPKDGDNNELNLNANDVDKKNFDKEEIGKKDNANSNVKEMTQSRDSAYNASSKAKEVSNKSMENKEEVEKKNEKRITDEKPQPSVNVSNKDSLEVQQQKKTAKSRVKKNSTSSSGQRKISDKVAHIVQKESKSSVSQKKNISTTLPLKPDMAVNANQHYVNQMSSMYPMLPPWSGPPGGQYPNINFPYGYNPYYLNAVPRNPYYCHPLVAAQMETNMTRQQLASSAAMQGLQKPFQGLPIPQTSAQHLPTAQNPMQGLPTPQNALQRLSLAHTMAKPLSAAQKTMQGPSISQKTTQGAPIVEKNKDILPITQKTTQKDTKSKISTIASPKRKSKVSKKDDKKVTKPSDAIIAEEKKLEKVPPPDYDFTSYWGPFQIQNRNILTHRFQVLNQTLTEDNANDLIDKEKSEENAARKAEQTFMRLLNKAMTKHEIKPCTMSDLLSSKQKKKDDRRKKKLELSKVKSISDSPQKPNRSKSSLKGANQQKRKSSSSHNYTARKSRRRSSFEIPPSTPCLISTNPSFLQNSKLSSISFEDAIRMDSGDEGVVLLTEGSWAFNEFIKHLRYEDDDFVYDKPFIQGYQHLFMRQNKYYIQLPFKVLSTDGSRLLDPGCSTAEKKHCINREGMNIAFLGSIPESCMEGYFMQWNSFFLDKGQKDMEGIDKDQQALELYGLRGERSPEGCGVVKSKVFDNPLKVLSGNAAKLPSKLNLCVSARHILDVEIGNFDEYHLLQLSSDFYRLMYCIEKQNNIVKF